jgi:hypothetical protein
MPFWRATKVRCSGLLYRKHSPVACRLQRQVLCAGLALPLLPQAKTRLGTIADVAPRCMVLQTCLHMNSQQHCAAW